MRLEEHSSLYKCEFCHERMFHFLLLVLVKNILFLSSKHKVPFSFEMNRSVTWKVKKGVSMTLLGYSSSSKRLKEKAVFPVTVFNCYNLALCKSMARRRLIGFIDSGNESRIIYFQMFQKMYSYVADRPL